MLKLRNSLKELRLKNGLTQEALAGSVNVTRQTIISIEKEKYTPSVRLALHLARALEVPLEAVFRLDETKEGDHDGNG